MDKALETKTLQQKVSIKEWDRCKMKLEKIEIDVSYQHHLSVDIGASEQRDYDQKQVDEREAYWHQVIKDIKDMKINHSELVGEIFREMEDELHRNYQWLQAFKQKFGAK